jgi:hypothetical protein
MIDDQMKINLWLNLERLSEGASLEKVPQHSA